MVDGAPVEVGESLFMKTNKEIIQWGEREMEQWVEEDRLNMENWIWQ